MSAAVALRISFASHFPMTSTRRPPPAHRTSWLVKNNKMMSLNVLFLFIATSPILLAFAEHKVPVGWKTCRASDPELEKCLKVATRHTMKLLKDGNAYLGLGPLDPFNAGQVHLNRGGKGPLHLDMALTEVALSGFSVAKLESVKADLPRGRLAMRFKVPLLTVNSKYRVRGRVLLIPVQGEGRLIFWMENVRFELVIQGHKQRQGRKDFLKVDAAEFDFQGTNTTVKFINPAHAQQAEFLSRVVSENNRIISHDLHPSTAAAMTKRLKDYVTPVFDIPLDDLFPK